MISLMKHISVAVLLLKDIDSNSVMNLKGRKNPFLKGEIVFLENEMNDVVGAISIIGFPITLNASENYEDFDEPFCITERRNVLIP